MKSGRHSRFLFTEREQTPVIRSWWRLWSTSTVQCDSRWGVRVSPTFLAQLSPFPPATRRWFQFARAYTCTRQRTYPFTHPQARCCRGCAIYFYPPRTITKHIKHSQRPGCGPTGHSLPGSAHNTLHMDVAHSPLSRLRLRVHTDKAGWRAEHKFRW